MSKKSNYTTTNRSKHYLKIHLIFVCKVLLKPPYIPQTKDLWVFRWSYIKYREIKIKKLQNELHEIRNFIIKQKQNVKLESNIKIN